MAIEYNKSEYGSSKGILAFPDHYVAVGQVLEKDSALAVTEGNRKVVKAGTIFPANDATAIGIILNDADVTNGDVNAALVIHGFVKTSALPEAPDELALPNLKGIHFMPVTV